MCVVVAAAHVDAALAWLAAGVAFVLKAFELDYEGDEKEEG